MLKLNGIKNKYIKEIHKNIVLLSEKKWHLFSEEERKLIEWKYQNVLEAKKEFNIKENDKYNVEYYLKKQKELIEDIKRKNQPIIDELTIKIVEILKEEMPNNLTDLEKVEYIFDYVINVISYNEEWNKYFYKLPPLPEYDFQFYKGVPLGNTDEGILVTKSAMCKQISNLLAFLGKQLGINIYVEEYSYNNNKHAINYILSKKGKLYINATSVIRKRTTKEESFLLPREKLDKKSNTSGQKSLEKKLKYDMESIVEKTSKIKFKIIYTKY